MANNTTLNAGSGGDTIRDLDRTGVKTPIVALDLNPAGAETLMAGAMPVKGTGTAGTASTDVLTVQGIASMTALKVDGSAVTQPVSGTITVNAGTNLNTSLLALESGGHLASVDGKTPALGQALAAASVPVVLTAAQLTTLTPLSTVAVTGTFFQATQPVSIAAAVAVTQSGTWTNTVTQATAANLNATVVGTGTFAVQATQAGTWNVGTVTTVTTVSAVTAITNPLPAGTNLLGKTSASPDTSTLYNGTTALTPKFATFSTSAAGATTVVAAVVGKQIRVLRWRCTSNGATNVKWQSHLTPTDISGLSYLTQFAAAGGGYCPVGHFQTVSGEALDINNSLAVAISGEVTYIEV